MNKFSVKTPVGYLMVEEKGAENEYPGVYISFSKDGKQYDVGQMIACVEYDNYTLQIETDSYRENEDTPIEIVPYNNEDKE